MRFGEHLQSSKKSIALHQFQLNLNPYQLTLNLFIKEERQSTLNSFCKIRLVNCEALQCLAKFTSQRKHDTSCILWQPSSSLFNYDRMRISQTCYIFLAVDIKKYQITYIAKYSLVLIRMIQPLNSCMALVALQSLFAFVPPIKNLFIIGAILLPNSFDQSVTIFGKISEELGRSPEVAQVMRVYAALRIM